MDLKKAVATMATTIRKNGARFMFERDQAGYLISNGQWMFRVPGKLESQKVVIQSILQKLPDVDPEAFLELVNMEEGGGVSLSFGSMTKLDRGFLNQIAGKKGYEHLFPTGFYASTGPKTQARIFSSPIGPTVVYLNRDFVDALHHLHGDTVMFKTEGTNGHVAVEHSMVIGHIAGESVAWIMPIDPDHVKDAAESIRLLQGVK